MEWRIFFIGPMPEGAGDHFDQMIAAVTGVLRDEGYERPQAGEHELASGQSLSSLVLRRPSDDDTIVLIRPHELFQQSSIRTNVFDAIDDADLVVADLSGVRPTVVYELALAHALGIWTILLGSNTDANAMFYFRDLRHARVDFGADDIRSPELQTGVRTWLRDRSKRFDSANPFTDFYRAPIPDISAANGLAYGYFDNFLHPVLTPGSKVVDTMRAGEEPPDVAGVLLVRPPHLRRLRDVVLSTGTALEGAFPEAFRRGERGTVYVDTRDYGDRTCEFVIDNWVIDVPRTLLTLERSPRLRRMSSTGAAASERHQRAHDNLSSVLIERFLEVARHAVADDADVRDVENRFFYGSVAEIIDFLRADPQDRPSVWR